MKLEEAIKLLKEEPDYSLSYYKREKAIDIVLKEIERLNKKIEQYENPEDMTLMFMWCNEKAKDEIKRLNNIIKRLENILVEKLDAINNKKNTMGELAKVINPDIKGLEMAYKDIQSILKELKGGSSNE